MNGDPARAQKGLDPRLGIKVIFQGTRNYSRRDERRPPAFVLGAISGEDSKERIEVTEIEILRFATEKSFSGAAWWTIFRHHASLASFHRHAFGTERSAIQCSR